MTRSTTMQVAHETQNPHALRNIYPCSLYSVDDCFGTTTATDNNCRPLAIVGGHAETCQLLICLCYTCIIFTELSA